MNEFENENNPAIRSKAETGQYLAIHDVTPARSQPPEAQATILGRQQGGMSPLLDSWLATSTSASPWSHSRPEASKLGSSLPHDGENLSEMTNTVLPRGSGAPFRCKWAGCKYQRLGVFPNEACLVRHVTTAHLEPFQYECPSCSRSFRRKDRLKVHIRACYSGIAGKRCQAISVDSPSIESGQSPKGDGAETKSKSMVQTPLPSFDPIHLETGVTKGETQPTKMSSLVNQPSRTDFSPFQPSKITSRKGNSKSLPTSSQETEHSASSQVDEWAPIDVEKGPSRNLEHILDPDTHYARLEMLEFDTADICNIASGPIFEDLSEAELFTMIESVGNALLHLQSAGFSGNRFSIIKETSPSSNIAEVTHVYLGDIENCVYCYSRGEGSRALSLLYKIFDPTRLSEPIGDFLTQLKTLTICLSIGLLSFSGSHVCPFPTNLWGLSEDSIPVGFGHSYRSRKMACLDQYLKGPCWVLGTAGYKRNEEGLKISLTVEDMQELWGPVQLVGGTPTSAPLLRTQRGFIVPLPREYQRKESMYGTDCHWTESVPGYVENQDHIWLSNSSLIIIGTDAKSQSVITVNPRCKSKGPQVEESLSYHLEFLGTRKDYTTMEGYDVQLHAGYEGFGVGARQTFRRNSAVTLKDNIIWECQQADPALESLLKLQVGLEISLCTGNARRVSLWEVIRLYHIEKQGSGPIGCEHSIASPECAQLCWVRGNREASSSSIDTNSPCHDLDNTNTQTLLPETPCDLKMFQNLMIKTVQRLRDTGIDHEGHLRACWPFSDPAMSHRMKTNKINRWIGILSDSPQVATFAVVSSRCLGFEREKFPSEWSPCPQSHSKLAQINCLSTTVLQRPLSGDEERLKRQRIGLLTPPSSSSCDSDNLSSGTAFRLAEKQLWIKRFWRENETRKMMAHPFTGHYLREVATSMRWSAAIDFKEQINPDLKGGHPIDLVILSKSSGGQPSV